MDRRDLLFATVILAGIAAIGPSLAPHRSRSTDPAPMPPPPDPGFRAAIDRVDRAIRLRWAEEGILPTPWAPDLAILRRVSLGLTGSIPSLEEIRRFESLPPDARIGLRVDEILRERRSTDYLAERFARVFVGTEAGPFLVFRRRRFVSWLSDELIRNRPYDQIARDLIADRGFWTDHPATNFVSVTINADGDKVPNPERLAARVARAFLGARIDCAQCHDHPFQPWKRGDFRGIAAFFGQVQSGPIGIIDRKGEFRVDDRKDGKSTPIEPRVPYLPELDPGSGTRRERLARWTTDTRNPNFARVAANRAWALLFGRPLIDPVDDLGAVAEVPEPLKILADDFAAHGHDLLRLFRLIASTEAFALDSATADDTGPTESAEAAWAAFPLTRLRPEQVAGALLQAASTATIDAESHILVRLATFGGVNDFVARHGDPGEEEFRLEPSSTIPQRLLMMNGDLVEKKTRDDLANAAARIAVLAPDDNKAIDAAYLATLTRRPSPEEAEHFRARLAGTSGAGRKGRMTDLVWALLNATEFSWCH